MDNRSPIAVVGMAGVFPGAFDADTFWTNILNRFDATVDVPDHRWIEAPGRVVRTELEADRAVSRRCCLIEGFRFDPAGYAVAPQLLADLDPVHHLVLHAGREAAFGQQPPRLDRQRTGVVLAAIALPTDASSAITRKLFTGLFEQRLFGSHRFQPPSPTQRAAARMTAFPAALLARALGLGGGSTTLDAACASSLVAVKLACDALHAGRLDAVLAGGVSRPDCLYTQIGFSQLRALSPTGRCAPFDHRADGLVVGEGAGILVLKRLPDAVADKDRIIGLIRGIGVSNDMRGNLLAPDSEGQVRAMRMAYDQAGWTPRQVDLIECHGTGAPVGDATELRSLRQVWEDDGRHTGRCAIGSVKSMIGHLLTAAGAAGIIKTLQAVKHGVIPPSLHFQRPPQTSPLHDSPFRVPAEAQEWTDSHGGPRKAAVSAFGFGGINAHLLIEQWQPPVSAAQGPPESRPAELSATAQTARKFRPAAAEDESIRKKPAPVAIVGMGAAFGPLQTLGQFQRAVFEGRPASRRRPTQRWKGCDEMLVPSVGLQGRTGAFIDEIRVGLSDFHIPPREIPDILPQHLLMLQTAAAAMADARLLLRTERPQMGVAVGIDFDFEATNFHFRWSLPQLAARWNETAGLNLAPAAMQQWLQQLQDAAGPPLTATRTLGALGSIVASRIARELKLGGPSFTVSADEASGLKALEIAVHAIQQGEVEAYLVGAVDLFGELRRLLTAGGLEEQAPLSSREPPADAAGGLFAGDGAAAVVLKPLDRATADGDRVYAVLTGLGHDSQGGPDAAELKTGGCRALRQALEEAGRKPVDIAYVETAVGAVSAKAADETEELEKVFADNPKPVALGSTHPVIGCSGAAAGLAAVVKTALCLHHKLWPAWSTEKRPQQASDGGGFETQEGCGSWKPDRDRQLRRACVVATTVSGETMAAMLESAQQPAAEYPLADADDSRRAALLPETAAAKPEQSISVVVGGPILTPVPPPSTAPAATRPAADEPAATGAASATPAGIPDGVPTDIIDSVKSGMESTARAHQQFLEFSEELTRSYARSFDMQTRLLEEMIARGTVGGAEAKTHVRRRPTDGSSGDAAGPADRPPVFSRQQCLEFAVGKAANVLGPDWAAVDSFPARVRLPDEPLMLVDRIVDIAGEPLSMTTGRIVTEHDVRPDAWYLDAGRAPVCISVEAGQADLFLCSYLGVDLKVKGQRLYRLLDASVVFHRSLPAPGETIRYEIHIDKFIRQAETILFFFRFEGSIAGKPLISMTDGCAGFFTEEEIHQSGGILPENRQPAAPRCAGQPEQFDLVPLAAGRFGDDQLAALRSGELERAFGPAFKGVRLAASLRLPGGRMKLIDRILAFDPQGGPFGLGEITAEADIHPDDWFLTCHFVDDMTMPGTLMYECCAHTLRVFLQRIGWITEQEGVCYEPVTGVKSVLKCRGPVTPSTRSVLYRVEIKEIGYGPEPYAVADAHMFADGRYIVQFIDMTLQMTGLTRQQLQSQWRQRQRSDAAPASPVKDRPVVFDRKQVLEFATGTPSKAFGAAYRRFDEGRFVARLPAPPYSFIDRIVEAEPPPGILEPGGWIEAETDVRPDSWYFRAERTGVMPYSVLMETALQSCGWLAAWCGSALTSDNDLRFRNLDGRSVQHREVTPDAGTLTTRCRLVKASRAADIIIEEFEFQVLQQGRLVFEGNTSFGFFTPAALAGQTGLQDNGLEPRPVVSEKADLAVSATLEDVVPITPDDTRSTPAQGLCLPARAIRMIDRIDWYQPSGGARRLGIIQGSKRVDPREWFFNAHFYQDPVCPGSLGVESFLQLLKFAALQRWRHLTADCRFGQVLGASQIWKYRGQILPDSRVITVQAAVTDVQEAPVPEIRATGHLFVDGLCIYRMQDFGVRLVPLHP